jgi:hypothetical protein
MHRELVEPRGADDAQGFGAKAGREEGLEALALIAQSGREKRWCKRPYFRENYFPSTSGRAILRRSSQPRKRLGRCAGVVPP